MKKILVITLFLLLLLPKYAFASIGVGVGTGKIEVKDKLRPGTIYELPTLTVLNTGDEPSDYEVGVSYHDKQPQLMPPKDWFTFSPAKFHLDPGKAQVVDVKLNLPLRAQPGDYFAYLEGRPAARIESGGTRIGVAAAAKLYFTVVPASPMEAIYYKILSFWKVYSPWPQRVLAVFAGIVIVLTLKKYLHIQIGLKKNKTEEKKNE